MKTIVTLLLIISALSLNAQGNHEKRQERIRTLKVGFLTEKLDLSTKEAQGFWPIYNMFDAEMAELRSSEFEALHSYRRESENVNEEEAQEILTTILNVQEQRAKKKTDLAQNLKGVISIKKILTLFKAEEDFRRKLLRELRNRKK